MWQLSGVDLPRRLLFRVQIRRLLSWDSTYCWRAVLKMPKVDSRSEMPAAASKAVSSSRPAQHLNGVLKEAFQGIPHEMREPMIATVVRETVCSVFRLDVRPEELGDRDRLTDLGMDSLIALELRSELAKRLGLEGKISSTIAFDTGTVGELLRSLVPMLANEADAPLSISDIRAKQGRRHEPALVTEEQLQSMSEEEVEQLLKERLSQTMTESRTSGEHSSSLSPLKQAFLALERAQARIQELENASEEPIAIVGIGCRIPGGEDGVDGYWRLLQDRGSAVTHDVEQRFADSLRGKSLPQSGRSAALLERVDLFDPRHFGISPREAVGMDPQQRLLLEVSWEALENAGIDPIRLVSVGHWRVHGGFIPRLRTVAAAGRTTRE